MYDALGQLAAEYWTTASTPACTTCYLSYDHLGTPRLVTDSRGIVIARHDYLPFGEEATVGRNSQWGAGNDDISQKFTGYERDTETGLDFAQARYYGSALGRFTSPDPMNAGVDLTNPQSWNAYAYVLGNPLNGVDPTGMDAVQPCTVGNPIDVCSATVNGSAPAPVQVSLSQTPENYYQMGWGQGGPLFYATGTASAGLFPGSSAQGSLPAASSPSSGTPPRSVSISCSAMLPNGRTVGSYVQLYRAQLESVADQAIQTANMGRPSNPMGEMMGAFYPIAKGNGPIDFKNIFRGTASAAFLGQTGNFAYYAIGSGILPDSMLDAGAGAYAVFSALRGQKQFSSLTGPMFSDASAASVRNPGLTANGCGS